MKCDPDVDFVLLGVVSESVMKGIIEIDSACNKNSRSSVAACSKSRRVFRFWWLWDFYFIFRPQLSRRVFKVNPLQERNAFLRVT